MVGHDKSLCVEIIDSFSDDKGVCSELKPAVDLRWGSCHMGAVSCRHLWLTNTTDQPLAVHLSSSLPGQVAFQAHVHREDFDAHLDDEMDNSSSSGGGGVDGYSSSSSSSSRRNTSSNGPASLHVGAPSSPSLHSAGAPASIFPIDASTTVRLARKSRATSCDGSENGDFASNQTLHREDDMDCVRVHLPNASAPSLMSVVGETSITDGNGANIGSVVVAGGGAAAAAAGDKYEDKGQNDGEGQGGEGNDNDNDNGGEGHREKRDDNDDGGGDDGDDGDDDERDVEEGYSFHTSSPNGQAGKKAQGGARLMGAKMRVKTKNGDKGGMGSEAEPKSGRAGGGSGAAGGMESKKNMSYVVGDRGESVEDMDRERSCGDAWSRVTTWASSTTTRYSAGSFAGVFGRQAVYGRTLYQHPGGEDDVIVKELPRQVYASGGVDIKSAPRIGAGGCDDEGSKDHTADITTELNRTPGGCRGSGSSNHSVLVDVHSCVSHNRHLMGPSYRPCDSSQAHSRNTSPPHPSSASMQLCAYESYEYGQALNETTKNGQRTRIIVDNTSARGVDNTVLFGATEREKIGSGPGPAIDGLHNNDRVGTADMHGVVTGDGANHSTLSGSDLMSLGKNARSSMPSSIPGQTRRGSEVSPSLALVIAANQRVALTLIYRPASFCALCASPGGVTCDCAMGRDGVLVQREFVVDIAVGDVDGGQNTSLGQSTDEIHLQYHIISKTCASLFRAASSVMDFGTCSVGDFRKLTVRLHNMSDIKALIKPDIASDSLGVPSQDAVVEIPPRGSRSLQLDYVARYVDTSYSRQVTLVNMYNKHPEASCTLTVTARNVDTNHVLLHSQFYKILPRNSKRQLQVYFDTCLRWVPNVRVFGIKNITRKPLALRIVPEAPGGESGSWGKNPPPDLTLLGSMAPTPRLYKLDRWGAPSPPPSAQGAMYNFDDPLDWAFFGPFPSTSIASQDGGGVGIGGGGAGGGVGAAGGSPNQKRLGGLETVAGTGRVNTVDLDDIRWGKSLATDQSGNANANPNLNPNLILT